MFAFYPLITFVWLWSFMCKVNKLWLTELNWMSTKLWNKILTLPFSVIWPSGLFPRISSSSKWPQTMQRALLTNAAICFTLLATVSHSCETESDQPKGVFGAFLTETCCRKAFCINMSFLSFCRNTLVPQKGPFSAETSTFGRFLSLIQPIFEQPLSAEMVSSGSFGISSEMIC